jgi:imidazolonepropionase-like amidohydrolase
MRRLVVALALVACGRDAVPKGDKDPWRDPTAALPKITKRPRPDLKAALVEPRAPVIALRDATIMTATGTTIEAGTIVLKGGAIVAVGPSASTAIPDGARVVEGKGKVVTPGIIDAHSHIGVYAAPSARAHDDGNEASAPVTAQARAQYAYWPQDPQISRAAQGGVTTALILPGSANLIGGEGFTVAMRPGRTTDEVAFPGAPATIKMACGENPKRVYKEKAGPNTRMGEYAAFRAAFYEARSYLAKRLVYDHAHALWLEKSKKGGDKPEPAPEPPAVDLKLETLASVLREEVLVQIHCYKASDIREMVAIADEFGFPIRSFHHALEAYKVRDLLVAKNIAINTWADWWGFKLEAFDGIPENAALFHEQGGKPTIHSDSAIGIQRLNQEAAKAMASGRAIGIDISDDAALRWITANPAWVLGIHEITGTLAVGKRADVVMWSGSPFSVYSRAELVIAGGLVTHERSKGLTPSDFELGTTMVDVEVTR